MQHVVHFVMKTHACEAVKIDMKHDSNIAQKLL